jgi:diguanylate cyclase (GGDEF)-like protein/PAS domain S-box-containing protein
MSQTAFDHGSGYPKGETFLPTHPMAPGGNSAFFFQTLLDNLIEGVVFLDPACHITAWNLGMEQLTGMGNSVLGKKFTPSLLQLRDLKGEVLQDSPCPFQSWMQKRATVTEHFILTGRSGRELQVELNFHPVYDKEGRMIGATVVVVDTSTQLELQKQLNELYALAVLDPLTQVANRAEFERLLDEYVRTHLAIGLKCSIIIADIDFFKQINDNFGHHIGDQALIAFAQHIKKFVRTHDFVARYGGEEFVILCANCDEPAALERAEEIRSALASTRQPTLSGKCITASFGVSELVPDDSATGLFVRADQALLKAKELGRNRVIASSLMTDAEVPRNMDGTAKSIASGIEWRCLTHEPLVVEEYAVALPMVMMLEKIRGFIEELDGDVLRVENNFASLQVDWPDPKQTNRNLNLVCELELKTLDSVPEKLKQEFPKAQLFLRVNIRQELNRWSKSPSPSAAEQLLKTFLSLTMLHSPDDHIKRPEMATESKPRY